MADVEEDVRRQVAQQISQLQTQLKAKEELIENLQRREEPQERVTVTKEHLAKKDENDNFHMDMGVNSYEDQLEGQGEKSIISSTTPKLLRLQSIQDQAKAEIKRYKKVIALVYLIQFYFRNDIHQSAHEENYYLVERIKHLENLVDEMATSNQEVIDETVTSTEDYKMRV